MLLRTIRKQFLAWRCFVASCIILTLSMLWYSRTPCLVTLLSGPYGSPALQTRLESVITPFFITQHTSGLSLFEHIRRCAPTATSCCIRFDYPHHSTVTINLQKPLARINQETILTEQGICVPSTEYLSHITQHLPHITVEENLTPRISSLLRDFACTLPAQLLEKYRILWKNKTEILLIPLTDAHCFYLFWHTTQFTPELLKKMCTLEQQLKERSSPKNKPVRWQIDLRQQQYCMVKPVVKGGI